jgi:uncharacterized protein YegP (UPF0339 family)
MAKNQKKLEIYLDDEEKYRWRLKSSNSNIVSESGQGYETPAGVMKGLNVAFEGFSVRSIDHVLYFCGSVSDGRWPDTREPKYKSVNYLLVLDEKVEAYLWKRWTKEHENQ